MCGQQVIVMVGVGNFEPRQSLFGPLQMLRTAEPGQELLQHDARNNQRPIAQDHLSHCVNKC